MFTGLNDTIGCLLDTAAHTISYTKNGEDLGVAFEVPLPLRGRALYPAVCLKNAEVALNFGGAAFAFSPPHGFVGIVSAPAAGLVAGAEAGMYTEAIPRVPFLDMCSAAACVALNFGDAAASAAAAAAETSSGLATAHVLLSDRRTAAPHLEHCQGPVGCCST